MSATAEIASWKGIDTRVLEAFGVSEGVSGYRVPYFDRKGRHYRTKLFKFEGEPRSYWLKPQKPQIPYGVWRLAEADKRAIILTEGESDTWALTEAFPRTVAIGIPGASSWKSEWAPILAPFKRVFLSFDGDAAGLSLGNAVLKDVPGARVVPLPEGADTRSLLQGMGKGPYYSLLKAAEAIHSVEQAQRDASEALHDASDVAREWAAEWQ